MNKPALNNLHETLERLTIRGDVIRHEVEPYDIVCEQLIRSKISKSKEFY